MDSAQSKVDGVKQTKPIRLTAVDETSTDVEQARSSVNSIIQQTPVPINATDNTAGPVGTATRSVNNIIQQTPVPINATDNTAGPVGTATWSINAVKQRSPVSINATDNTSQVANNAQRSIASIPTWWGSSISASVFGYDAVSGIKYLIDSIPTYKETHIRVSSSMEAVPMLATGGRIIGPGTGTSDSVPAMLSNGEMVIRAASVRKLDAKYGAGWLEYLNRMGEIPNRRVSNTVSRYRRDSYAFASGGRVRVDEVRPVTVNQMAPTVRSGPTYNTTQNIYYPAFAPTQITLNKKLDTAATYQM